MHQPTDAERIEYPEIEMISDYLFSTNDIAPVNLNREVRTEMVKDILDNTEAEWEYIEKTSGKDRTVIHYYELELPDGEEYSFEHHQCGLESAGNNVKFEGGAPDSLMWDVVVGVNEKMTQKRREEVLERLKDNQYTYEFLGQFRYEAVAELAESVKELEEGDFLGLEMKVDTYNEKISDAVSTRSVLRKEDVEVKDGN